MPVAVPRVKVTKPFRGLEVIGALGDLSSMTPWMDAEELDPGWIRMSGSLIPGRPNGRRSHGCRRRGRDRDRTKGLCAKKSCQARSDVRCPSSAMKSAL